jgi:hypothetical protein
MLLLKDDSSRQLAAVISVALHIINIDGLTDEALCDECMDIVDLADCSHMDICIDYMSSGKLSKKHRTYLKNIYVTYYSTEINSELA